MITLQISTNSDLLADSNLMHQHQKHCIIPLATFGGHWYNTHFKNKRLFSHLDRLLQVHVCMHLCEHAF